MSGLFASLFHRAAHQAASQAQGGLSVSDLSKDVVDPIKNFFGGLLALLGGSSNPAVASVTASLQQTGRRSPWTWPTPASPRSGRSAQGRKCCSTR
jgi:hypothetical protein